MKIQNCRPILLVLLTFCFLQNVFSQSLCLETPSIRTELEACNSNIAHAFAPEIHQLTKREDNDPQNFPEDIFIRDIPTAINYDGNWDGIDNWENLNTTNLTNASVYYAVWWLEKHWVIRYYLYYPHDWANEGCGIFGLDEHEHDIEEVTVIVRRPINQTEADDPSLLSYGTSVSSHGERDFVSCPPTSDGISGNDYAQGQHPIVHNSIGSHAIYYNAADAFNDSPFNPCEPVPNFTVIYFPSSAAPLPSLDCGNQSCSQPYTLIDMFDFANGVWEQRDNPLLWDGDKLRCDNGGSCRAGMPWLGGGARPACEMLNSLGTLCNNITGDNSPVNTVGCNDYIYNGYCDTVITDFRIKETICCGTIVNLDGVDTDGEDRYKIDITNLENGASVSSGWVDGNLTYVDLDELWYTNSGGQFQVGKTYEVCLTPRGCTWGDELCKKFTVLQPAFNFQLLNDLGQLVQDGGIIEPGSRPQLDPTEHYCLRNYQIKICESPIPEGDLGENDDCNWFYSGLEYGDDPVDLVDAVSTGWPNTFSFRDGYEYQICMYSESTCTVPICQTVKVQRSTGVVCGEETSTEHPFCYRIFHSFCPPESNCDPCNLGGAICVYESDGVYLDMNDYIFWIDLGTEVIESLTPCFQFTAEQTPLIEGFHLYNIATGTTEYVALDLCGEDAGIDDGKFNNNQQHTLERRALVSPGSEDIAVYPNPTTGNLFIHAPGVANGQVRISDLLGRTIYSASLEDTNNIDLSTWNNGIYLISILDDQFAPVKTEKIVKH